MRHKRRYKPAPVPVREGNNIARAGIGRRGGRSIKRATTKHRPRREARNDLCIRGLRK